MYRTVRLLASIQPDADTVLPAIRARIQHNTIGKRVRFTRGDGRDMILIPVDDGEDLQRSFLEHILHGLADFGAFYNPRLAPI